MPAVSFSGSSPSGNTTGLADPMFHFCFLGGLGGLAVQF